MHRSYGLQHLRHKQPTRRNRGLPSLVHSAASCCWRNFLFRHAFIYIHFPVLCEPPLYQQGEKIWQSCRHKFYPNRSSLRLSTSCTNGPRLFSRVKVGIQSALLKGSHTTAHTAKHGVFWVRAVSLPSARSARSRTSPGRVSERHTLPLLGLGRGYSRRTQRASGTAMRLCASLSRGVAAPLGCVIFFAFVEIGICTSGAHGFPRVRGMGGITTLGALCVLLKYRTAACQSGYFAVF